MYPFAGGHNSHVPRQRGLSVTALLLAASVAVTRLLTRGVSGWPAGSDSAGRARFFHPEAQLVFCNCVRRAQLPNWEGWSCEQSVDGLYVTIVAYTRSVHGPTKPAQLLDLSTRPGYRALHGEAGAEL